MWTLCQSQAWNSVGQSRRMEESSRAMDSPRFDMSTRQSVVCRLFV